MQVQRICFKVATVIESIQRGVSAPHKILAVCFKSCMIPDKAWRAGMQLLIDDGKVFGCYDNIDETIYHSELGSSNVILRAGYNIASFMVCCVLLYYSP